MELMACYFIQFTKSPFNASFFPVSHRKDSLQLHLQHRFRGVVDLEMLLSSANPKRVNYGNVVSALPINDPLQH